ncbi:MAG: co-chaperone GroES [Bacteroidetes bacterium]|jgi:co-chaperonin GroES (HSP10)|nr:co-chaperone GroES [Bacteroidota bacterium]
MIIEASDFRNFIVVGDRVLVQPKPGSERTDAGLYLPPTVKEKEAVRSGYVVKVGPGYPVPNPTEIDEPWKQTNHDKQYFPLQAREGDLAVYLQSASYDLEFKGKKYCIIPHNAILLLVRDEDLFH